MKKLPYRITLFDGVHPKASAEGEIAFAQTICVQLEGAEWELSLEDSDAAENGDCLAGILRVRFCGGRLSDGRLSDGRASHANVAVLPATELLNGEGGWHSGDYLFAPAALYNGNRFRALHQTYPPMFHAEDGIGPEMETLITDVPRLDADGGERLVHFSSGDMAVPCMGGWSKGSGRGFLLYGTHITEQGYTGLRFRETTEGAELLLEAPCVREKLYHMMDTSVPSDDLAHEWKPGETLVLSFRLYQFECHGTRELFERFRQTRRCMGEPSDQVQMLPFSEAYSIIREKYVNTQFTQFNQLNAEQGYYMVSPEGGRFGDWQSGWVGGGINAFALELDSEGETSGKTFGDIVGAAAGKAVQSFDTIYTKLQAEGGFVCPILCGGVWQGDDFCHPENGDFLLLRKNADLLHVTAKYIFGREKRGLPVSGIVRAGFTRLADAFVRLYERHGQLGQFVNLRTGEILAGGTASAGIAVGGLALACRVTGVVRYLEIAKELAAHYRDNIEQGALNGGPGEILQCPDSESAFGLLEGLMSLYDVSGEREWLLLAADCADQAASWCMPYDFTFPVGSEFGRLAMRTTGSVFANVQNKHSAPAICTLSPVALVKLSRACEGDVDLSGRVEDYQRLAQEIAHNTVQYLSRADRPIHDWDGGILPPGWMCERVNTSDWEGKNNIGGVFRGSCWCEVSTLLTYNEIPGIWIDSDRGGTTVFDHLCVEHVEKMEKVVQKETHEGWRYALHNPTDYPARVKVLVESGIDRLQPWGECRLAGEPVLDIPAGGTVHIEIKRGAGSWMPLPEVEDL